MFWSKSNDENKDNEKYDKWGKENILKFLISNFEEEINEETFDNFEEYVRYRKNQMSVEEKIEFLLNQFRDEIEEELFEDFDNYVEFRRAIKKLGYD